MFIFDHFSTFKCPLFENSTINPKRLGFNSVACNCVRLSVDYKKHSNESQRKSRDLNSEKFQNTNVCFAFEARILEPDFE